MIGRRLDDTEHLIDVVKPRAARPAQPEIPIAQAAHDHMHVVSAKRFEDGASMHQAVVGDVVGHRQAAEIEFRAELVLVSVFAVQACAICDTVVGPFFQ